MTKTETYNQLSKSKTAQLLSNLNGQAETLKSTKFETVEQMAEKIQPLALAMSQLAATQAATARTLEIEMASTSVKLSQMHELAENFNERQQASQLQSNLIWVTATIVINVLATLSVIWLMPVPKISMSMDTKTLAQQITALQAQATPRVRRK